MFQFSLSNCSMLCPVKGYEIAALKKFVHQPMRIYEFPAILVKKRIMYISTSYRVLIFNCDHKTYNSISQRTFAKSKTPFLHCLVCDHTNIILALAALNEMVQTEMPVKEVSYNFGIFLLFDNNIGNMVVIQTPLQMVFANKLGQEKMGWWFNCNIHIWSSFGLV